MDALDILNEGRAYLQESLSDSEALVLGMKRYVDAKVAKDCSNESTEGVQLVMECVREDVRECCDVLLKDANVLNERLEDVFYKMVDVEEVYPVEGETVEHYDEINRELEELCLMHDAEVDALSLDTCSVETVGINRELLEVTGELVSLCHSLYVKYICDGGESNVNNNTDSSVTDFSKGQIEMIIEDWGSIQRKLDRLMGEA